MKINNIEVKNLLTKSALPDADFVINPYGGCNHGCIYCYAEFMIRFNGHKGESWGTFMDIKNGAVKGKTDGKTILLGSVTDPYNPLEKKYEKTRGVLLELEKSHPKANVEILTKSPLVLRDIDILNRLGSIKVGISVSTLNDEFARVIEKSSPPPSKRLEAIKKLNDAGIPVYIFISPIFPYISDYLKVAEETGKYAEKICFENLNLRGKYKQTVLNSIKENFPDKYDAFAKIYSSKEHFKEYWLGEETKIHEIMKDSERDYKIYFFHEKIKKQTAKLIK